jgi:hypothetical protein
MSHFLPKLRSLKEYRRIYSPSEQGCSQFPFRGGKMGKHSIPFRVRVLAPALVIAWLGAGPVNGRASTITLDVTGALIPDPEFPSAASCSTSGCTISGYIVIDNSPGAHVPVISADITAAGETPTVGPFTAAACALSDSWVGMGADFTTTI